jgi:hypothetical protein
LQDEGGTEVGERSARRGRRERQRGYKKEVREKSQKERHRSRDMNETFISDSFIHSQKNV